ncbi:SDR family NAD(P)-dependent oxidoreductase [Dyella telluris]|uniref:SDR family NAD(P)-dependent oxidoreductase n=1 Tax=Dyella telluris TaxID=2763498 RepID=A0A7G8Q2S8_9GAMM|nr:SDR family NAD(P)-dependent oxidoreductase [Dyella telluris]QNK01086.1 SDR family NAD(P)-dependent oxidoreductase [Dyella telluris]
MSKVWLVTGSSRGLGRDIVEAALAHGDRVVATARRPEQLADLAQRYGDQVRAVTLDVADAASARAAVQSTVDAFGRLDVLVNNAGYGNAMPFEQSDEAGFRAQVETNFYGVVNLTRAALPVMRAQRSGHILQISSVGGRIGVPGLSAYQSAKWAVGGFTEVVAAEVEHLGIKVCALEPGGMRTGWAEEANSTLGELMPDYEASVGTFRSRIREHQGKEASDPARVAQVVLTLAYHEKLPRHLLLGSDALHYFGMVEQDRVAAAERWREVSLSTDFNKGPMPAFPAY